MSDLMLAARAPRFDIVPVHGVEILAARDGDAVRIPMKSFCGAIGLPWEPQRKRIMRDPVLSKGASMMEVPSSGGLQEQLTLPLTRIAGFLFTAESRRYAPELRERVELFREECFEILHHHFFARREPVVADVAAVASIQRETMRLFALTKRERNHAIRRSYHGMLEQALALQGLPAPALDQIGADALSAEQLVGPFMRGLETLSTLGVVWNHGGRPGLIAFDLAEVLAHFERYMIAMPAIGEMARALRDHGPVVDATVPMISNITGRHHLCWVFKAELDA